MENVKQYKLIDKTSEKNIWKIYSAFDEDQEKEVDITLLSKETLSSSDIARIKHDYEAIKKIDSKGILKIYGIFDVLNDIAIVQEKFDAQSLSDYLKNNRFDFKTFLELSVVLSESLIAVHEKNIIYKNINSASIFYNEKTNTIKISNFVPYDIISYDNISRDNSFYVNEILPYYSPEQTGRINRSIDHRSDFYSLGIVLYEMLTGKVPFKSDDPIEIIYSHIARNPEDPGSLVKDLPPVISRIILKLLAKNANERYQNARGLSFDLRKAFDSLVKKKRIDNFKIASQDISLKFLIPQIIYGRNKELELLNSFFDSVCHGNKEIVMVSGHPGIGKTALVSEIRKPIIFKRGFFISGKYDQFRRDVPYSAILNAFSIQVKQLLTESEKTILKWKDEILEAVGPNGNVITNFIPEIKYIIGEQPEVSSLGPEEEQNRFIHVFSNFASVFAQKDHPLVIFLDDLQWADSASFNLIKILLMNPEMKYLYFIGSYRDNEVFDSHLLTLTMNEMEHGGFKINRINLGPVGLDHTNELISNFLRSNKENTYQLAETVIKKTGGNPFFVNQFLKKLYENGFITLDTEKGWVWDLEKINSMKVTDNVVEFLAEKISSFPENIQDLLKICACIGNWFELEMLSQIYEKSIDETLELMTPAVDESIISMQGDRYVFHHDRIQEAVYSLIPDEKKSLLHYRVGKIVLDNITEDFFNDKILYITNQFNSAIQTIRSKNEELELANLNLLAGEKAVSTAAFESAFKYFKIGIDLVQGYKWSKDYTLILQLYESATESAYLTSKYETMYELADEIRKNVRNDYDLLKISLTLVRAETAQNELGQAVQTGLAVLKKLGVRFPKRFRKILMFYYIYKIKSMLKGKKINRLKTLPRMTDPGTMAILEILTTTAPAAYWSNTLLSLMMTIKIVFLSIEKGNDALSPSVGYAGIAGIFCSIGDIEFAYEIGEISIELQNKLGAREREARLLFFIHNYVSHWKKNINTTLEPLKRAFKLAIENGDKEYAAHSAMVYCHHLLDSGNSLGFVVKELGEFIVFLTDMKHVSEMQLIRLYHQVAVNLSDPGQAGYQLIGDSYNVDKMMEVHSNAGDKTSMAFVTYYRIYLAIIFEEYDNLNKYFDDLKPNLISVGATTVIPAYNFYYTFYLLDTIKNFKKKKRKKILKKVEFRLKRLKKWAGHCPENCLHRYQLIKAELLKIEGNNNLAMEFYRKAIDNAHKNNLIHEEAFICKVTAKFFDSLGFTELAIPYMKRACSCYLKWGANSAARFLQTKYKDLLEGVIFSEGYDGLPGRTEENFDGAKSFKNIDLASLMKISQAISGEMNLKALLEKITIYSMEHAGAQRAFLIFENNEDKRLYVESAGEIDGEINVLKSVPVEGNTNLSSSIVNYVYTTQENVVINDAKHEERFYNDEYIKNNDIKSILCAPIRHKGKMSGIIYLENNVTTNAFTPDRLEMLLLFSTQAAISIENTILLSEREKSIQTETEMGIAADIQTSLLPENPKINGYEITAYMKPADDVGGDYYDVIHNENNDWVIIGDVSGHGIPAGLVMMMTQSSIHTVLKNFTDIKPSTLLEYINKTIYYNVNLMDQDKYMTISALSVNGNGKIEYSGLHQDFIIYRKNKADVEIIPSDGMWIGIFENVKNFVIDQIIELSPGDVLFLFSDGITEAWKKGTVINKRDTKDMYGEKNIVDILKKNGHLSTDDIGAEILKSLDDYVIKDDVTFFIMKKL